MRNYPERLTIRGEGRKPPRPRPVVRPPEPLAGGRDGPGYAVLLFVAALLIAAFACGHERRLRHRERRAGDGRAGGAEMTRDDVCTCGHASARCATRAVGTTTKLMRERAAAPVRTVRVKVTPANGRALGGPTAGAIQRERGPTGRRGDAARQPPTGSTDPSVTRMP